MKISSSGINKIKTRIPGFDEVFEGGIPQNRSMLVIGSSGTGKTLLLNEFIHKGIENGENGVFITFEEHPEDIVKNVASLGWDYKTLIRKKKLAFVDFSPTLDHITELDKNYNLAPIIERIKYAVKKTNAKRVVIDTLGNLFLSISNKNAVRNLIFKLGDELKKLNVTSMISAEESNGTNIFEIEKMQEYVADGVVILQRKKGQLSILREMSILKVRGTGYRSGYVEFEITDKGMIFYPKIPINLTYAKTDFSERKGFGIKRFDKMLDGGIPKGHVVMVSGNTGTGKSTLGLHFLEEGIKKGENCIFINLEEPIDQIKKSAKERGWDLEESEKKNKLVFITPSLIDINIDKLLYKILNVSKQVNAKRVLIDSISSLESATYNKEKVREFLIQLYDYFKTSGITSVLNYLITSPGESSKDLRIGKLMTNEMRLSSVIDGVILLRYFERDRKILKVFNILKLRGSYHDRGIHEYEITKKGIIIPQKDEATR